MNYGFARIFKESLLQSFKNTMYTIIATLVLTIYYIYMVNNKGTYATFAIGVLFAQWILYIGVYFIVLFMVCYTCQNISLAISFSCTRKQAVAGVYIIELLMSIFLVVLSVTGALTAGVMGADINLKIWILQAVLISLISITVANIGSIMVLKMGRTGYIVLVLMMGFAMGFMVGFIKPTLVAGYRIMGGFINLNATGCITGIIAAFVSVLISMYIYYLAIRKFVVRS